MLRKILALGLLFALVLPVYARAPIHVTPTMDSGLVAHLHRSMHVIILHGKDDGLCTAYALAPHALLTADHCTGTSLNVDNEKTPRDIAERISDGADHVILLVTGPAFVDTIDYDPDTYAPPTQGQLVVSWGNPWGWRDMYHSGYFAGTITQPIPKLPSSILIFDMNVNPGDSGSSVFDANDGHLVTLVTYTVNGRFMGAYLLQFTPGQVALAKIYRG